MAIFNSYFDITRRYHVLWWKSTGTIKDLTIFDGWIQVLSPFSGRCFGTWLDYDFPFSWEWKIIPTVTHSIIFQRGRYTTKKFLLLVPSTMFQYGKIRQNHWCEAAPFLAGYIIKLKGPWVLTISDDQQKTRGQPQSQTMNHYQRWIIRLYQTISDNYNLSFLF